MDRWQASKSFHIYLEKGDVMFLVGLNQEKVEVVVGEIITDTEIGWFEGVLDMI